jgi:hypothetical protein
LLFLSGSCSITEVIEQLYLFPNSDKNEEQLDMIEYGAWQRHVPSIQKNIDNIRDKSTQ